MKKRVCLAVAAAVFLFSGCTSIVAKKNLPESRLNSKIYYNKSGEESFRVDYNYETIKELFSETGTKRAGKISSPQIKEYGTEIIIYDIKGNIVSETINNSDGRPVKEISYKYGDNYKQEKTKSVSGWLAIETTISGTGRKIVKACFDNAGKKEWEDHYLYGAGGNLSEEVYYNGSGERVGGFVYSYKYNKNGYAEEKKAAADNGGETVEKYFMEYDEANRIIAKTTQNSDGELKQKESFKYQNNALILRAVSDEFGNVLEQERFDEKGRVIEKRMSSDSGITYKWNEYNYDAGGRIAEEKVLDSDGELYSRIVYSWQGVEK